MFCLSDLCTDRQNTAQRELTLMRLTCSICDILKLSVVQLLSHFQKQLIQERMSPSCWYLLVCNGLGFITTSSSSRREFSCTCKMVDAQSKQCPSLLEYVHYIWTQLLKIHVILAWSKSWPTKKVETVFCWDETQQLRLLIVVARLVVVWRLKQMACACATGGVTK